MVIENNHRVKQLENQIRWFKNESSKLAQTYEYQKQEIEKLKGKYNILDDNKFIKEQAKGCKRHNNILRHALNKNIELLDQPVTEETVIKHIIEPENDQADVSSVKHQDDGENIEKNIQDQTQELDSSVPAIMDSSHFNQKEYTEGKLRETTFDQQNAHPYERSNDYVNYGLDYEGVEKDPNNVDPDIPLMDYVLQLLCNPKCTNKIFKQKMLEYQHHKDRSLDREINYIQNSLSKFKKKTRKSALFKLKTRYTDEISYRSELQNFFLDCVKETKNFIQRKNALNRVKTAVKPKQSREVKRNIRTFSSMNKRRGARNRPKHILNFQDDQTKSFQSYKDESSNEVIDGTTQMLVMNEDIIAEVMAKLSSLDDTMANNTDATFKNISGVETSDENANSTAMPVEELLNLSMSQFNTQNRSFNRVNTLKENIVRKESEESYNKLRDPKSSYPWVFNTKLSNTSYSTVFSI